ncbi:magnesium and cobalt transport protein CorA [[Mycobacterium] wendilense]|uniref:Magnesium and cobalt transport protein CorA n=1 Tax=[Mycobacterium] wendilense TaxID=3064284 RepID=A0ABM9MAZ3_9MYCO|nr:magnesium and cobalt transport protein CorA [Mycolicibacterium sp. MU0050]CAJ1580757.1 magnesium and cobalt transport protein CorA [Mycolicibacterium sp. MU0050]
MPSFRAVPTSSRRAHRSAGADAQGSQQSVSAATVDCAVYVDGERLPDRFTHATAIERARELEQEGRKAYAWVGLHEPDEQQMHSVAEVFDIHPLAVEDAVHAHQRPKLERYDNTLFLVLKTVNYVEHESVLLTREIVETGEIMVFVGPDFVVTVRHGDHSGLAGVRKSLEERPRQLALGPFAVMHAIADHVVDSYLDVTTLMEVDIDAIEEETFSPTSKTHVGQIYMLKREVVELRRAVAPLSVELGRINSEHRDLMSKELVRYMRDVLDHQTQAADRIASYDEMLSSLVHAALAKVSVQQNIDMRKISAWVAMAAVPTMIAGIYGMNFEYMPELAQPWAYPTVLLVMVLVCALLYRTFRRNHWL